MAGRPNPFEKAVGNAPRRDRVETALAATSAPTLVQLGARVLPDSLRAIKILAAYRGTSVQALVQQALDDFLAQDRNRVELLSSGTLGSRGSVDSGSR